MEARGGQSGWRWLRCAVAATLGLGVASPTAVAQCGWNERVVTASNATTLGASVALGDDFALVGAPFESTLGAEAGAAYLLDRSAGWSVVKVLHAPNAAAGQRFGSSVATAGDLAIVGAPGTHVTGGAVHVFERHHGGTDAWGEAARLVGFGGSAPGSFGASVALWQDWLVVAAPNTAAQSGAAYVLRRGASAADWTPVKVLTPADPIPLWFGSSVAIDADTILVGAFAAPNGAGVATGAAYVFERDDPGAGQWGQVAKLLAPDGELGDRFGRAVAVGQSTIVVGAYQDADLGLNAGSAYVFERGAGGAWSFARKLLALDGGFTDEFGLSLALVGDELLVGARGAGVNGLGQAYVFERDLGGPGQWGERERFAHGAPGFALNFFGASVALAPGVRLVGAPNPSSPGWTGAALAFTADAALSSYCTTTFTGPGCRATLTALGCPSASSSGDFRIQAHGLEGSRLGMFFYGVSGRARVPWGSAETPLCIQPPLQRWGLVRAVGSEGRCDGRAELDWNAMASSRGAALGRPFFAGQVIQVQLICRSSPTSKHSAMSNALEFTLTP